MAGPHSTYAPRGRGGEGEGRGGEGRGGEGESRGRGGGERRGERDREVIKQRGMKVTYVKLTDC